jgi:membrane protease YdiL (CAAX protease family)
MVGPGQAASIQTFLPQRAVEILLWIGVSMSAGVCEELVFRGYFQKQFEALAHSRWAAFFLQAMLFGIAHGYQGIEACVKIACFGGVYGLFALWRKSLRPGMIAHAWSDVLSGIFGI